MKKILVIRYGGVGDVITTLPVLKSLKKSGYTVVFASNSRYKTLLEKYTEIDGFISVDSPFFIPLFSGEKSDNIFSFLSQFDFIISYTDEEELFSWTLKKLFKGKIIFHSVKPEEIKEHIIEYVLKPIYGIASCICTIPEIKIKYSSKEFFVIHPGSGSPYKNWSREKFLYTYKETSKGLKGLIILGYAEKDQRDFWYKNIPSSDIAELEKIEQVVYYAERSYFYLGNDSGISHLFSAAGVPSFVIFGPTSPHIWSPRGKNVKIIYKNVQCSPCTIEKRKQCKEQICLDSIDITSVIDAIKEYGKEHKLQKWTV